MTKDELKAIIDPDGELAKHAGPGWVKEIVDNLHKSMCKGDNMTAIQKMVEWLENNEDEIDGGVAFDMIYDKVHSLAQEEKAHKAEAPTTSQDYKGLMEAQILIWDKCELHHEPGDYEAGVGDEWWLDSRDGEFQTGLSVIGWPSSYFFPAKGRLVFIPEPGLAQKALEAIKKDEAYWKAEGQKLGEELDLISDKHTEAK